MLTNKHAQYRLENLKEDTKGDTKEDKYRKIVSLKSVNKADKKALIEMIKGIGGDGVISGKANKIKRFVESLNSEENCTAFLWLADQIWQVKEKLLGGFEFLYGILIENESVLFDCKRTLK